MNQSPASPNGKSKTAILVDDERLARKRLRMLLAEHPRVQVVGEAQNVEEAVALIQEKHPNIVFLDIQMPRASGFELLERVEATFHTVFVTAYDTYAIRAFEVNALDYLLKPVQADRLAVTVSRLIGTDEAEPAEPVTKLAYDDRAFIPSGREQYFVRVSLIKVITAQGDYTHVKTSDGRGILSSRPLAEWIERLPEDRFARIHRSTVVNTEFIEKVEKWFRASHYVVHIQGESEPLPISRRFAPKLWELLNPT